MRLKALECPSQEWSQMRCEGECQAELLKRNGILTDKGMGIMKKFFTAIWNLLVQMGEYRYKTASGRGYMMY
jgi:hypothetical protein